MDRVERKLAAILSADVVDYSRLMGEDEAATIETLAAYRRVFVDATARFRGRVVDAKGDAILAEFASVVDAVACAVEIQRELAERNARLPAGRAMHFRIGVNLGDVVVREDAIYGEGVNIAARLEALAEPGGVCISGKVHSEVKSKLPLEHRFLGNREVKNIPEPIPAYQVLSAPAHRVVWKRRALTRSWKRFTLAGIAAAALVAGGVTATWYVLSQRLADPVATGSSRDQPAIRPPVIAVLPFTNMSDDSGQEFFADGITEELIALLAQFHDLAVIARNSMFTYKGRAVDVRTVGREMGADFVLEGSVRRSADRLRITAQLLSAADGKHLWAETYDRKLTTEDLFDTQDELARRVGGAIGGQYGVILSSRIRESVRKPPDRLES
jgi:TolB-like protein/class 3 adenylate cyclase